MKRFVEFRCMDSQQLGVCGFTLIPQKIMMFVIEKPTKTQGSNKMLCSPSKQKYGDHYMALHGDVFFFCIFASLDHQPMVNCWFGARWFGFLPENERDWDS